jgi:DNA-binding transcriptional MerR regulator
MRDHFVSIGEIARGSGVSVDTIRHYEKKGVITDVERAPSGYRRYPQETVDRVRVIRRALNIGFTLDELARIFRHRASGDPPCRKVRDLAAQKLQQIDERISELTSVRAAMLDILAEWDVRLASTAEGEMAHLLESLIESKEDSR